MKNIVIAVDFDGTCVAHEFPNEGRDIGAVPVLRRLVAEGHKLVLFTMRSGAYLETAVQWFLKNDVKLWGVQYNPDQALWTSSNKCYAQLYIDDAALGAPLMRDESISERPFIDWSAVEKILEIDGVLVPTDGLIEALREDMAESGQLSPIEQTPESAE